MDFPTLAVLGGVLTFAIACGTYLFRLAIKAKRRFRGEIEGGSGEQKIGIKAELD